ncbi:hypothetical protein QBC39DRAFT_333580 [Podospora conica]|nr:hypothetical protein QBC39DRAFT_333580 [Schizothecium conicum]
MSFARGSLALITIYDTSYQKDEVGLPLADILVIVQYTVSDSELEVVLDEVEEKPIKKSGPYILLTTPIKKVAKPEPATPGTRESHNLIKVVDDKVVKTPPAKRRATRAGKGKRATRGGKSA